MRATSRAAGERGAGGTGGNAGAAEKPAPDFADVSYGRHPRQVLDLWRARGNVPAPLVVYIHGGGFRAGDKGMLPAEVLHTSLAAGLAVAAVNYRLSDSAAYPAFMLDCARALQLLRQRAEEWGIDRQRVAATGGSAGGGISLWLGFHPDLADPTADDPVARQSTRLSCLGVFNTQPSYDPRFYREVGLAPAAEHPFMPPFYGLTYEEIDQPTDEAQRLFTDAAAMTWFHRGGPPVFAYYAQADEPLPPGAAARRTWAADAVLPESDPLASTAIHHPRLGQAMQRRLHELGVECELQVGVADRVAAARVAMVELLASHLIG